MTSSTTNIKKTYQWTKEQDADLVNIYPVSSGQFIIDFFINKYNVKRSAKSYSMRVKKLNEARAKEGLDKLIKLVKRVLPPRPRKEKVVKLQEPKPEKLGHKRQIVTKTKIERIKNTMRASDYERLNRSKGSRTIRMVCDEAKASGMEPYRLSSTIVCFLPAVNTEEERQANFEKLRLRHKDWIW